MTDSNVEPEDIELLAAEAFALYEEEGARGLDEFLARHPREASRVREAIEGVVLFDEAVANPLVDAVAGVESGSWEGAPTRGSKIGDFTILSEIGRGGMGIVYRARQGRLRREVALKVLPPELAANPQWTKRFVREARSAGKLNHPGIVTVYDAGSQGGICYLAMELVQGESLAEIQHRGLPTIGWAVEICRQVAAALAVAHDAGLLHRDVKPANIMLSGLTAKLMDFGLVLDTQDDRLLTRSGMVLGTPAYMPPEQIDRPAELDQRADIFSLGVVLYECLTGSVPHGGETTGQLLREVREHSAPPPRRRGKRLHRDLETIVLRCLEKDPASRYETADDLAADLGRFARGETIRSRPIPGVVRAMRWVRQNRVLATATAGAAAVVIVAACLVVRLDRSVALGALRADLADEQRVRRGLEGQLKRTRAHMEDTMMDERRLSAELAAALQDAAARAERIAQLEARPEADVLVGLGRVDGLLAAGQLEDAELAFATLVIGHEEELADDLRVAEARQALSAARAEAMRAAELAAGGGAPAARVASDRRPETSGIPEARRVRELAASVDAAAARFLELVAARLRERQGERLGIEGEIDALALGVLERVTEREGELLLEIGMDGGSFRYPMSGLSEDALLALGTKAPPAPRAAFLLTRGRFLEAEALLVEIETDDPVAAAIRAGREERFVAPLRAAFPQARLSLVDDDRLRLDWNFEDGGLPGWFRAQPAHQWRVRDGRLSGTGFLTLAVPVPRDFDWELELATAAAFNAHVGPRALPVSLDAPGVLRLERRDDRLSVGGESVHAVGSELRLRLPASTQIELESLSLIVAASPAWRSCLVEPRQILETHDFTEPLTSPPTGTRQVETGNSGLCLEATARPLPPPPGETTGNPSAARLVQARLTLPTSGDKLATGTRFDLELRVIGLNRGVPRGELRLVSARGGRVLARTTFGDIGKVGWNRVTVLSTSLLPSLDAVTEPITALELSFDAPSPFVVQLRRVELSVAAVDE